MIGNIQEVYLREGPTLEKMQGILSSDIVCLPSQGVMRDVGTELPAQKVPGTLSSLLHSRSTQDLVLATAMVQATSLEMVLLGVKSAAHCVQSMIFKVAVMTQNQV